MLRIKLTKGFFALVDNKDYEYLSQWKWQAYRPPGHLSHYAWRREPTNADGKRIYIFMHRQIMNPPDELEIDHINGNGLDNQRSNMRVCTTHQNSMNRAMAADNKSGYKGVSCAKEDRHVPKPWRAFVQANGKRKHLGYFAAPEEAARAYDKAAFEHYGEFARTNKMMGLLP